MQQKFRSNRNVECGEISLRNNYAILDKKTLLRPKKKEVYKSVRRYRNDVNLWLTGFVTVVGTEVIRICSSGFEKLIWVRYPNKEKLENFMRKHE